VLRQREEWIRFSYSNEDTKDKKNGRLNVVLSAKRAPCPRTTPQQLVALAKMFLHFTHTIETATMCFATVFAGGIRAPSAQSCFASIPCPYFASCTGSGNLILMSLEHGGVCERSFATMGLHSCLIPTDPEAFDRQACLVKADSAYIDLGDTAFRAHGAAEEVFDLASRSKISRGSLVCLRYTEVAPILGKSLTYLRVRMIPHSGYEMERSTG
jgi:hypothetical protein